MPDLKVSRLISLVMTGSLVMGALALGLLLGGTTPGLMPQTTAVTLTTSPSASPTPVPTMGPSHTPSVTATATRTLLPPPTFEPPTQTVAPSNTPTTTPSPTLIYSVSIPGLHGAESPTPSTTPGCEPRDDWELTYRVQAGDALARIAQQYNTTYFDLAGGNCLSDANVISIGQVLRVPGEAHPVQPAVECVPWEVYTPFDGSEAIGTDGQITFNWRGPRAFRNLIRVHRPDGTIFERVVELRQNETVNLLENFNIGGTYTWYVYPLDENYVQIDCLEGGPWTFRKPDSPTLTPTPTVTPEGYTGPTVPAGP